MPTSIFPVRVALSSSLRTGLRTGLRRRAQSR